ANYSELPCSPTVAAADLTSAEFFAPLGVALDTAENLLIADLDNYRVRRVDASTQVITTVAGSGPTCHQPFMCSPGFGGDGGPATLAMLDDPTDVAVDRAGNLFITDTENNRV